MLFSLDTIARSDMYLVNDQVLCDCKEPITWIDCDIHGDLEPYAAKMQILWILSIEIVRHHE